MNSPPQETRADILERLSRIRRLNEERFVKRLKRHSWFFLLASNSREGRERGEEERDGLMDLAFNIPRARLEELWTEFQPDAKRADGWGVPKPPMGWGY